jgi:hypothetical protein
MGSGSFYLVIDWLTPGGNLMQNVLHLAGVTVQIIANSDDVGYWMLALYL